jgi:predicted transcriptional regulator
LVKLAKTIRIGIASYDDFKAHTMAIARGELMPGPEEPKVWVPSLETFAKVRSSTNKALRTACGLEG